MKNKTPILLTILLAISATAFGQTAIRTTGPKTTDSNTAAVGMPTAKQILAKYVEAIGGRKANEKITSRVTKGTTEISPMGIKGTFENYAAAPNKSYTKSTLAGIGEFNEGFDGQTAWSINPIQGSRDKQGEELAQAKVTNDFYRDINLDRIYPKIELKGTEKVGDADAYVLVGTSASGTPETFYFDTKSGLLLRQDTTVVTPEGKTPSKTFFEDYRDVDGIKIPFKTRAVVPQFEIITTYTEVKNNVAVEDSKIAKPIS